MAPAGSETRVWARGAVFNFDLQLLEQDDECPLNWARMAVPAAPCPLSGLYLKLDKTG